MDQLLEISSLGGKLELSTRACREMQHWKRYAMSFAVVMVAVAHLVGAQVNLTELMTSYLSACGLGYSCSDWSPSHRLPHTKTLKKSLLCPECSCDDTCFEQRNCCPDKFFARTYTRYRSAVVNFPQRLRRNYIEPEEYAVVDYCPPQNRTSYSRECEIEGTPFYKLTNPPVTSLITNVSYLNRQCAFCHGESEKNLIDWNLSVDDDCMRRRTIFYLSSYEEVMAYAQMWKCGLVYSPRDTMPVRRKSLLTPQYRTRCNVTGTWLESIDEIQMACESSYDLRYRYYTNIFCAMCNPIGTGEGRVIDTCNVTGEWREYDESLVLACEKNPALQMTHPYKNVFCLFCNSRASFSSGPRKREYFYNDVRLEFDEYISNTKKYMYIFRQIVFHNESLQEEIQMYTELNRTTERYEHGVMTIKDAQINITYLLLKQLSLYPVPICDKTLLPAIARNYTASDSLCNPQCMMEDPCQCGLDVALSLPITCIQDRFIPNGKPKLVRVFNACSRMDDRFDGSLHFAAIRYLCENSVSRHDILPVSEDDLSFRNIYCFLCNSQFEIIDDKPQIPSSYSVHGVSVECSHELNIFYSASFTDIISTAMSSSQCNIWLNTANSFECEILPSMFPDKCNVTRYMEINDPDVQWACEDSHYSKFVSTRYCEQCNPQAPYTEDRPIETCDNQSTHYDQSYKEACELFPDAVFSLLPPTETRYKNRFCRFCNPPCVDAGCTVPPSRRNGDCRSNPGSSAVRPPLLNMLFRFNGVSTELNVNGDNNPTHYYVCYPGKILVGGHCSALFNIDVSTKYTLNFEVDVTIEQSGSEDEFDVTSRLNSVLTEIQHRLFFLFPNTLMDRFIFPIQKSSVVKESNRTTQLTALVYVQTEAKGSVNRPLVEDALYHFPSTFHFIMEERSVSMRPGMFPVSSSSTLTARGTHHVAPLSGSDNTFVPSTAAYIDYLVSLNASFIQTPLTNVFIGPLLFCKQRVYNRSDFHVDYKHFELILKSSHRRFPMGEFVVALNGSIQICEQNEPLLQSPEDNIPLRIFTLTCTGVSLLCLLVTFVTYCMFKTLRTIPGLNLMSLVFSLFFAQLLFVFSDNQGDDIWCPVVGILLHYFWLCTCFCLLICCFHMYRVFNSRDLVRSEIHFTSRTFYRYFLFSYLVPLVVVGTNIGVMVGVSGMLGYGERICFVENVISNIILFIAPIIITCCLNCFFFLKTIRGISSSSKLRDDKVAEVKTFVKLFSITGLVWTVQMVNAFVGWPVLSWVSTALVCLQGCFIFFSFCFSRSIIRIWKESSLSQISKTNSLTTTDTREPKNPVPDDFRKDGPRSGGNQAEKYVPIENT